MSKDLASVARNGNTQESGVKGRKGAKLAGPMHAKQVPVKIIGLPSNTERVNQATKVPSKANPANPAQ